MKKVFGRFVMTNEFVRIGVVDVIVRGGVGGSAMERPVGAGDIARRRRESCRSCKKVVVEVEDDGGEQTRLLGRGRRNLWIRATPLLISLAD